MSPNLWGIINCTGKQFSASACWLHDNIVNLGWRQGLAKEMEAIKRVRPKGVIIQLWRGLMPDQSQAFFNRRRVLSSRVGGLLSTHELRDVVAEIKESGVIVLSYDGPPPERFEELPSKAQREAVRAEICGETGDDPFDGHIIDGAGDKDMRSATGALISAIDLELRPRIPTGVESQAVKGAEWWGDRVSLTLAGVANLAKDPAGGYTDNGSYDPERPITADDRLSPKFAKRSEITGEAIVLDCGGPGVDLGYDEASLPSTLERYRSRAKLIAASGCSPCCPVSAFDMNGYGQGFKLSA